MKIYYGRFKICGSWSDWHIIDGLHSTANLAKRKFIENTRFIDEEVEITNTEPAKYCGRIRGTK